LNPDPIRIRIRNTASWTWLLVHVTIFVRGLDPHIPIIIKLCFIKDGNWKAKKSESGSTKNIFTLFFSVIRESFDKENHEEEGRTGPRLYTTTFVPRIRSRSNKVPPYTSVMDPELFGQVRSGSESDRLYQNLHIFFKWSDSSLITYILPGTVADPDPDLFKETKFSSHRRVNVYCNASNHSIFRKTVFYIKEGLRFS
jgi:hypothetical protein